MTWEHLKLHPVFCANLVDIEECLRTIELLVAAKENPKIIRHAWKNLRDNFFTLV
jgi:hypothetical protein